MGDSALDNALYQYMLCLPSYWMVSSWEKLTGVQLSMCSSKTTFTPCKISSASASCQHLEGETILSKLTSTLLYTHTPKVTYLLSVRYLCHRKKKASNLQTTEKNPKPMAKDPFQRSIWVQVDIFAFAQIRWAFMISTIFYRNTQKISLYSTWREKTHKHGAKNESQHIHLKSVWHSAWQLKQIIALVSCVYGRAVI